MSNNVSNSILTQTLILLRPQRIVCLNMLRSKSLLKDSFQSFAVLGFCLLLACALFFGCRILLQELDELATLAILPISHLMGIFLVVLFFTLILSNLALTIGRFFQSHDNDLLLSAPVPFCTVFLTRAIQIFLSASWMPAIFLVPVLLALITHKHVPLLHCLHFIPVFILFLSIPTALAIIVATLLIYCSPVRYVRFLFYSFLLLLISSAWSLLQSLRTEGSTLASTQGMLKIVSILSLQSYDWLPSSWAASLVEQIVNGSFRYGHGSFILLLASSIALWSVAFAVILLFFDEALAHTQTAVKGSNRRTPFSLHRLLYALPLKPRTRAILCKEYLVLLRDIAQVVQLLLLSLLSILYLSNLETLAFASRFSQQFESTWTLFMIVTTISIGCFFVIAITTRLVFPSISMEGDCFTYFQTGPIALAEFLRIKFWLWFLPLSLVSAIFFGLAATAIHLMPLMVCAVTLFGILVAYLAVGSAIGFGAKFAKFDWEYSTQLAASFGSVFCMLVTLALITLASVSLVLCAFGIELYQQHSTLLYPLGALILALVCAVLPSILLVHFILRVGLNALLERGRL